MKRILHLLLCLCMISVMTGCKSKQKGPTGEELNEQWITLIKDNKFDEANQFYEENEEILCEVNEQTKGYNKYIEGVTLYESGCLTDALLIFKRQCEGILDSADYVNKITNEVTFLNGVFKNTSVPYDMFIVFKDGRIGLEFDKVDSYYLERLYLVDLTQSDVGYGIGNSLGIQYVFYMTADDRFVCTNLPGEYDTFSGVYQKISNVPVFDQGS